MVLWCSRWESNPNLALRRGLFYPLNYGNKSIIFTLNIIPNLNSVVKSSAKHSFISYLFGFRHFNAINRMICSADQKAADDIPDR